MKLVKVTVHSFIILHFWGSLLQSSTTEVVLPPSNFYGHFSNIKTNATAVSYRAVSYRAGSS